MEEKHKAYKLLLIDDRQDFLELLSYWLQAKGHHAMTALSCEAGLKIIESVPLDIVLLDMHMPKVNGVETLRRIRSVRKEMPVIIVTAYPGDPLVGQARDLGISGVFPKDGGFDNLYTAVLEVLQPKTQTP